MPLQEVIMVNGWSRGIQNTTGISVNALKSQYHAVGGVKAIVGSLAGMSACGYAVKAVNKTRFASKTYGIAGIATAVLTALAGGILINKFSRQKEFAAGFTLGGLGFAGLLILQRIPVASRYSPVRFNSLGTGTGLYSEDLFGLGEDELVDEDTLMDAPFSPESEYFPPAVAGDRTIRTAFNATDADAAIQSLGEDEDLVPTFTGM